jgi:membrane protease YdiL (CAAX protease family)
MNKKNHLVFIFVLLIGYINDLFFYCFQDNYYFFIGTDYSFRIIQLASVYYLYKKGFLLKQDFNCGWLPRLSSVFVIGVSISLLLIHFISKDFFNIYFAKYYLFSFPAYPTKIAKTIDLSVGLLLVALSEEIIFRGLLINVLLRFKRITNLHAGCISLVLFALIHYGSGVTNILTAFIWAIIPTMIAIRMRRINELIIIHWLTNLYLFI